MPIYEVERELFEIFPGFRRGVVVVDGADNTRQDPETGALLLKAASDANRVAEEVVQERVSVWDNAYLKFGANPEKYTPSIRFLREQLRRGKAPRSINPLVDLFNIVSLRWTIPCGGDDLDSLSGGDLRLGFARGDETFAPLFKPTAVERVTAGEVIYYTVPSRRVLCRRWTWRNSDFSKIRPETTAVAINLDMMMPPFTEADLREALDGLAKLVNRFCGGAVEIHLLDRDNPQFFIDTP